MFAILPKNAYPLYESKTETSSSLLNTSWFQKIINAWYKVRLSKCTERDDHLGTEY